MNYILAVSIESNVYKTPNLEFRLNNRLLDIFDLTANHSIEIQGVKKQHIYDLWGIKNDDPTIVEFLLAKKWLFFEIDEKNFNNKNTFTVTCNDFHTNYNNGFLSKMDKCRVLDFMLLPKKFFKDIKSIFDHCTSRNILADWMWSTDTKPYGLRDGWPMLPALLHQGLTPIDKKVSTDIADDSGRYRAGIWNNTNREISIIWDNRLELFRISHELHQPDDTYRDIPDHFLLSDYTKYCLQRHEDETLQMDDIAVPQPDENLQPGFTVNDETTYLVIHAPTIILLDKFLKNKYIYEDK